MKMQNEFHYLNALVIYISTKPTHFAKNFKRPHRIQDSQEKNDFIALVSEIIRFCNILIETFYSILSLILQKHQ